MDNPTAPQPEAMTQSEAEPVPAHTASRILGKGQALYAALRSGDAGVLQNLLSRDFQGYLCAGLPSGLGRKYDGLDAMMAEAWGVVDELFDLDVKVDQLIDAKQVLIGRGTYEGRARTTGKELRAAFAHFWQFNGTQFTSLQQVTDTGLWRDALDSSTLCK